MVVDTSALIGIIRREPEYHSFLDSMRRDTLRLVSVVALVEAAIVLERTLGSAGSRELEFVIRNLELRLEPVTLEQGQIALSAFWRFGRSLHPAALNFGDCFTYALAKHTNEPLLFKGNDFGKTDLRPADV